MMFSKERKNAILEELHGLISNGRLLPEDVIDAARNPNSVLHNYFTWDDSEAAHQFRLQEARALIKKVKVDLVRVDNAVVRVPSFIRSTEAGYRDIHAVTINKPDHTAAILITLAQVETMLRNLAAPELDSLIEHVASTRASLQQTREIAPAG